MEVAILVMLLVITLVLPLLDVILAFADPSDVDPIVSFFAD